MALILPTLLVVLLNVRYAWLAVVGAVYEGVNELVGIGGITPPP